MTICKCLSISACLHILYLLSLVPTFVENVHEGSIEDDNHEQDDDQEVEQDQEAESRGGQTFFVSPFLCLS